MDPRLSEVRAETGTHEPSQRDAAAPAPPARSATDPGVTSPRWHGLALAGVVSAFVLFAAWRASLGITPLDDGHYAAVPLRLAQGAHVFADEMTTQGLGFLPAVPFARLWTALFGLAGYVLALRLFYVAVAAAVGYVIYRALRPSFGAGVSALVAWLPLLAPPYNIFGISYNTSAILAFSAAAALGLAAIRDSSRAKAAAAGIATAVGVVSYPPLALGGLVFAVTLALVARDRRVILWFLIGAGGAGLLAGAWLLLTVSPHDVSRALRYSDSIWGDALDPRRRAWLLLRRLHVTLTRHWLLPMWTLAAVACLPQIRPRWRAILLALVPVLACRQVVPDILARGQRDMWLGLGTAWLTTSSLGVLPAVVVRVVRGVRGDVARLLVLTAPMAILDFAVVAIMTKSGWYWDVAFTGLAPFVMAVVVAWGCILRADGGRWVFRSSAAVMACLAVFLLMAYAFKEGSPLHLNHRIAHGPLAGIATTDQRAAQLAAYEALGRRWVRKDSRVLVFNAPLVYVLVGGRMTTNAVWLSAGPSDRYTVEYFARHHDWPDVAFVSKRLLEQPASTGPAQSDPLIAALKRAYRVVDSTTRLDVLVRR
jgi:hypothetical protein